MIEYVTGNILTSKEPVIVHGQNCFLSWSGGIAQQIYRKYKNVVLADLATLPGDRSKLGTITWAQEDDGTYFINAYTQYSYTFDKVDVEYDALQRAMEAVCEWAREKNIDVVSMPKIGAGAAGGNWNIISGILDSVSDEYNMTFRVYVLGT